MGEGWIKTYRSLADHWLWQDKPFSKGQAWIDLMLIVNHRDNKTLIDGRLEEIERGKTITSIRKLCDRWGWSNTKVKNFLKMLENDGMIGVKSDSKNTVINIVNYSIYQDCDSNKTTVERQSSYSQATVKHTNKNEKNEKNEKNIKTMQKAEANALFERVWKLYPLKRGKGQVSEASKRRLLDIGFEELERAIDRYKADLDKDTWKHPQNGSTFFNSGYVDFLDENYEKPKETVKAKNSFGDFDQRQQDYDAIELAAIRRINS